MKYEINLNYNKKNTENYKSKLQKKIHKRIK